MKNYNTIISEVIELFYNIGNLEMAHYAETYDICINLYNQIDGPCDVTRYTLEYAQITICDMLASYGLFEEARDLERVGFEF